MINFDINGIPAILWNGGGDSVIIAAHGSSADKSADVTRRVAKAAAEFGCDVLSFDFPGHGERKKDGVPFDPPHCTADLSAVADVAFSKYGRVGFFGCSIGAYFGLLSLGDRRLFQCLLLSPVTDMRLLIEQMMAENGVNADILREKRVIAAKGGLSLDWDYYSYVCAHPITSWTAPTSVLAGADDSLIPSCVTKDFCERFSCSISVLSGANHFFHTERELGVIEEWTASALARRRDRLDNEFMRPCSD